MSKVSKKNPALVELILVILFFSLSSILLVQVFAKAKRVSDLSRAETLGLIYAQSIIEDWKIEPENTEEKLLQEGWLLKSEGEILILETDCDEKMKPINFNSETLSKYHVQVEMKKEGFKSGIFYEIEVEIIRSFDQEPIISLSDGRYISALEVMP